MERFELNSQFSEGLEGKPFYEGDWTHGYGLALAVYLLPEEHCCCLATANAATVTFSKAAAYPDIRILEYSGIDPINPVDVFVGATGSGTTSNSGAVNTTSPTDLLVGPTRCKRTPQWSVADLHNDYLLRMVTSRKIG